MPSTMLRCADLTPQTHAAPACFANVGLRRDVVLYQKRAVGSSPLCRAVCLHNHAPLSSTCCVVCPQPPASRCDRCSVPCGLPCAAIGVEQRLGRIRRRACQYSRLIKSPAPTWPMHLIQPPRPPARTVRNSSHAAPSVASCATRIRCNVHRRPEELRTVRPAALVPKGALWSHPGGPSSWSGGSDNDMTP